MAARKVFLIGFSLLLSYCSSLIPKCSQVYSRISCHNAELLWITHVVLHSSPQEDDVWKSQWPGAVHQRIWTRAWCQKIKRFALLFVSSSVNTCRAALFPAGVKIGKVFDSFQICFKPNRDAVGIGLYWGKTHLWHSFLPKFCFSGPAGLRGAGAASGSWSCRWNLAGMETSAAELVIKPSKLWSWDEKELQLSTRFPARLGPAAAFQLWERLSVQMAAGSPLSFLPLLCVLNASRANPSEGWQESASYLTLLTYLTCCFYLNQGPCFHKQWRNGFKEIQMRCVPFHVLLVTLHFREIKYWCSESWLLSLSIFLLHQEQGECVLNIIWLHVCVKLVCSLPVLSGWTN